jgi:hypothetical protein
MFIFLRQVLLQAIKSFLSYIIESMRFGNQFPMKNVIGIVHVNVLSAGKVSLYLIFFRRIPMGQPDPLDQPEQLVQLAQRVLQEEPELPE